MRDTSVESGRRHLSLLLLITAGVMAPALWGEFVYDDLPLVVQNPRVHSLTGALFEPLWGPEMAYWRPVPGFLMALSLATGGATALHGWALIIHLAATCVAFGLARDLTRSVAGGLLAATLFALHPAQVESIAWGSAVQDPLVGLFILSCLRSTLQWRQAGSRGTPTWAITWFGLALLSKETGMVTLPAVIVLDRWVLGRRADNTRRLYLGLALTLLAYLLARVLIFGSVTAGLDRVQLDPSYVGARLWIAPVENLGMFTRLLLFPWPLLPFRDVAVDTSIAGFLTQALWLIAPISLLAWAWRSGHRASVFGLALALLTLAIPALRFHSIGKFPIADRYLYLAVFGFAVALAPLCSARLSTAATIILGATYAVIDSTQIPRWRSQESLIAHGLQYEPESPSLLNMQGNASLRAFEGGGDPADLNNARRCYLLAVTHSRRPPPEGAGSWRGTSEESQLGLAWCELLRTQGETNADYSAAIQRFAACTQAPGAPAQAWIGLGISYGSAGRIDMAEVALVKAVTMAPDDYRAQFNLGFLYARTQRPALAIPHLEKAVQLQPANQAAANELARLR